MGLFDFFAPALCPYVADQRLLDHTHLIAPAAAALEPYTAQLGVLEGEKYQLIAPLFLLFGTTFIVSYVLWGVLGIRGAERCVGDPPPPRELYPPQQVAVVVLAVVAGVLSGLDSPLSAPGGNGGLNGGNPHR